MSIKIVGDPPPIKRLITNCYSLDRAFKNKNGDLGFPYGVAIEIFGPPGCGKSTLSYSLSGILAAHHNKNIVLADFEGLDPDFMITVLSKTNFDGTVYYVAKQKDEDTLDEMIDRLAEDENAIAIIDSVGAISPVSELDGKPGEMSMGRRAKLVAQVSRKSIHLLRDDANKTLFVINHVHPNLGFAGTTTPGGQTLKYLVSVRIRLKQKEKFPDGSYVLEGTIKKNRWGYNDNVFYVFMLAGYGLHRGLTAMYDGMLLGKVKRSKVVKIGDKSFGYLKNIVAEAHAGNDDFFTPFFEVLNAETEDTGTDQNSERKPDD